MCQIVRRKPTTPCHLSHNRPALARPTLRAIHPWMLAFHCAPTLTVAPALPLTLAPPPDIRPAAHSFINSTPASILKVDPILHPNPASTPCLYPDPNPQCATRCWATTGGCTRPRAWWSCSATSSCRPPGKNRPGCLLPVAADRLNCSCLDVGVSNLSIALLPDCHRGWQCLAHRPASDGDFGMLDVVGAVMSDHVQPRCDPVKQIVKI